MPRLPKLRKSTNHHLVPDNAILFVEGNGTKMVSSSDDKKVLVWEWDMVFPSSAFPIPPCIPCTVLRCSRRNAFSSDEVSTIRLLSFKLGSKFAL